MHSEMYAKETSSYAEARALQLAVCLAYINPEDRSSTSSGALVNFYLLPARIICSR
jgi:hypothetical protein